jgi:hypothetical protein
MNNSPLPEDDNIDHNIKIDEIIEDKLFDNRYAFREHMTEDDFLSQYNFEMRPYIYPDVE